MVKVVIAGAGNLGLHISRAILDTGKHDVVILSRSGSTIPSTFSSLSGKVVPVSYDDHASLVAVLEGVHTVISTIVGSSAETTATPQLSLLAAAVEVGVKRFAPSEFMSRWDPNDRIAVWMHKQPVSEAVMKSGLEHTFFENGIFMDYLAAGTPGIGHLRPFNFIFDVEGCKARMPGDGEAKVVYTRVEDIARFVAASLELETWPQVSQMCGERLALNEVLRLAEEARGKPFEVTHVPKDQLVKMAEDDSSWDRFYGEWSLDAIRDHERGYIAQDNLNEAFPDIKPMRLKEFLIKWWRTA